MTATASEKTRLLALVALASVGVGLALVYRAYVWPWVAPPERSAEAIEERWVRASAAVGVREGAPGSSVVALADAAQAARGPLREIARPITATESSALREVAQSDELTVSRALEALVRWADEAADLGPTCGAATLGAAAPGAAAAGAAAPGAATLGATTLGPLDALQLGRAALLCAETPDDPSVAATLRLIRELHDHQRLVATVAADALAVEAALVFAARGWAASAALRGERPERRRLLRAMMRDAVCVDRQLLAAGAVAPEPERGGPPALLLSEHRDRLVFRDVYSSLFLEARAAGESSVSSAIAEVLRRAPRSVVLEVAQPALMTGLVRSTEARQREFDRALAAAP